MRRSTRFNTFVSILFCGLLTSCSTSPLQNLGVTAGRYTAQLDATVVPPLPISRLAPSVFSSPLMAVIAAVEDHNHVSIAQDREFIGAILLFQGVYRYTLGYGSSGEDTVSVRLLLPKGAEIVAFWHTHGAAGTGRKYFSAVDTALVKQWNKPFYLADSSGRLRVFRPGDSTMSAIQADRLGVGRQAGYAKGSAVLTGDGQRIQIKASLLAQR